MASNNDTNEIEPRKRSLVDWAVADRGEALELLREASDQLTLDGRVSARSLSTMRRIEMYLERVSR